MYPDLDFGFENEELEASKHEEGEEEDNKPKISDNEEDDTNEQCIN
jgi:hypothetical protein